MSATSMDPRYLYRYQNPTGIQPLRKRVTLTSSDVDRGYHIDYLILELTPQHRFRSARIYHTIEYDDRFPTPLNYPSPPAVSGEHTSFTFVYEGVIRLNRSTVEPTIDFHLKLVDIHLYKGSTRVVEAGLLAQVKKLVPRYNRVIKRDLLNVRSLGTDLTTMLGLKVDRYLNYFYWRYIRQLPVGVRSITARIPRLHERLEIV